MRNQIDMNTDLNRAPTSFEINHPTSVSYHVLKQQLGNNFEIGQIAREQQQETTFLEKQFPTLTSVAQTAEDAILQFQGLTPEIRETMTAYRESANTITEAASHFSSMIDNIKKMLEVIPAVKPYLCKILDALTLAYDIIVACISKMFYTVPTLIVRLFQLFGVDEILINKFVKQVVTAACSKEIVEDVAPLQAEGFALINMFTEGIGTLITGKTPTQDRMRYVNDALRYKNNMLMEFKSMGELALYLIRSVPDQLQYWISFVIPTKWWLDIFAPGTKFYDWIDEVNSLDSHIYTTRAAYDHIVQQKITKLHREGQELLKICTQSGTRVASVYKLLEASFKKIDVLYKIVDMSAINRGGRRVPFVVYMSGKAGVGKSFLMTVIPAVLAGCPHDTPNLSWARNPAIPHWDGYTGQYAVKYDDFGALTNSGTTGPGDLGEMMTIVSNEQMRLPMASLEDKGEVFRSQVVVISSNLEYIAATELRDAEALRRRRHFFYEVKVKPQYRKPGTMEVDPALIPADYSHWEFVKRDNHDPTRIGQPIGYAEFIRLMKIAHSEHIEQQNRSGANYEAMIAAANAPVVIRAEGLSDDFERWIIGENAVAAGGRIAAGTEAAKFYAALVKIDEEAEKPIWYKAYNNIIPFVAVLGSVIALGVGISHFVTKKSMEKKVKKFGGEDEELLKDIAQLLQHPRTKKLDAEGRWERLYKDLRGATPEMIKIFDGAMDSCPDFSGLTDEQVEQVIDESLRNPRVKKLLKAEGVYSGHHYKTQNRMTNLRTPVIKPMQLKAEGCIDQNAMEITTNHLVPHLGRISVDGYSMVAVMVGGRCLLTNYHCFCAPDGSLHKDGVVTQLAIGTSTFRCEFARERLQRLAPDVALYLFEATCPVFKDIAKHFIVNDHLNHIKEYNALMCTVDRSGIPIIFRLATSVVLNTQEYSYTTDRYRDQEQIRTGKVISYTDETDIYVKTATSWTYGIDSSMGMCGSPIVMLDKYIARKLVGIHAASNANGIGIAHIVTEEMIREGMRKFGHNLTPCHPKVDDDNMEISAIRAEGNFSSQGVLYKYPRMNDKTRIIPSLTHGRLYEPTTAPAVLNPADPRAFNMRETTPLRQGIEKYGQVAPVVDSKTLDRVVQSLIEVLSPLEGKTERRVLTQDEALNGIKGDDFVRTMDMTTSAGYPWNQKPGVRGKHPYIQRGILVGVEFPPYEIVDKDLQLIVDQRLEQAKKGCRTQSLWIDTLKDERRSLVKIFSAKTRVFTNPPVDFTIVGRMLLGAFNSAFYQNRLKFFSAVGIDPGSLEWTQLYKKLADMSPVGFGGDFSGWDGNLSPQFMMGFCKAINAWYGDEEENQIAREVLFDEMIHTPHCALNSVYYTHIGNPSGNLVTVQINTAIHFMVMLYIYYKQAPPEYNSLTDFLQYVVLFIYGDDGIVAIRPEILSWFNPKIIAEGLRELNLEYTNATKSGPAEIIPIERLTFLKRGFRPDDFGRMLAPIEIGTIKELTNWTKECSDLTWEQASIDNLNDALHFMYDYGKTQFEIFRKKILNVLEPKYWVKIRDYTYYHRMFTSKCEDNRIEPLRAEGEPISVGDAAATASNVISTAAKVDAIRTSDNTKGIILEAQRDIEVSGPTLAPKVTSALGRTSMPDIRWNLQDMVNRRVWVNTYAWSVSQTAGTLICSLKIPQDVIVNYTQSAAFERFVYCKPTIALDFELTGMRQQLGMLRIFAVPFTDIGIINQWQNIQFESMDGLNPGKLSPATNVKYRLLIPYYNPKSYISINGPAVDANIDFTATACVVVRVPLGSATCAQQTINMTVWASFGEETEFHVPINSSATGKAYNREHAFQLQRNAQAIPSYTESGNGAGYSRLPIRALRAEGDSAASKSGTDATAEPPMAPSKVTGSTSISPLGDAKCMSDKLHFGEKAAIQDIRSLLRRYYPTRARTYYPYVAQVAVASGGDDRPNGYTPLFNTTTPPANTGLSYAIFEVEEVQPFLGSSDNVAGYNYQVENYMYPLSHFGLQYRFMRGSLRKKGIWGKAQLGGADITPVNYGVAFIPHGQYLGNRTPQAVRPNWAWLCANVANKMLGDSGSAAGGDSIEVASKYTGIGYAQDLAGQGMVNYVEIEIPFSTIYNVLPTVQGVLAANLSPDMQMPGVLIWYSIINLPYSATPGTAPVLSNFTILTSVGDDFRYGTFLGVPPIYPNDNANAIGMLWPDTWVITPRARAVENKQQERIFQSDSQSSDEDFEKLGKMTKSVLVKKLAKAMRAEGLWDVMKDYVWPKEYPTFWNQERKPTFFSYNPDTLYRTVFIEEKLTEVDKMTAYKIMADFEDLPSYDQFSNYRLLCKWRAEHRLNVELEEHSELDGYYDLKINYEFDLGQENNLKGFMLTCKEKDLDDHDEELVLHIFTLMNSIVTQDQNDMGKDIIDNFEKLELAALRMGDIQPLRAEGGSVTNNTTVVSYGNMDGTCIPQKLTADDFQGAASGNTVSVPAFDRAARSINPVNNVRKYIQNFTHSKGSELVTRLDLDPSNLAESKRDHFSTNINEMDIEFLIGTPTWVVDLTWLGSATYGTSLYSAFIGPMFSLFTPKTTTQVVIQQGVRVKMTQWEYNTMHFAFWRGPIHIRLELVATVFHAGRLCLTLNYGAPPGVQSGLRDATSQFAVEFELSNEKSTFDYDIPFISPTTWKRTCRGPSSPDDPEVAGAWWNDYFTGSFDISVVTQLQTVCNAPPDATIIVSMSAAPGYEVYMPSNINQTFAGQVVAVEATPRPLALRAEGDTMAKPSTYAIARILKSVEKRYQVEENYNARMAMNEITQSIQSFIYEAETTSEMVTGRDGVLIHAWKFTTNSVVRVDNEFFNLLVSIGTGPTKKGSQEDAALDMLNNLIERIPKEEQETLVQQHMASNRELDVGKPTPFMCASLMQADNGKPELGIQPYASIVNAVLDVGFKERTKKPEIVEPVFASLIATATIPKPPEELTIKGFKYEVRDYIKTNVTRISDERLIDILAILMGNENILIHRKTLGKAVGVFGYRFQVRSFTQQQWVKDKRIMRVNACVYNNNTMDYINDCAYGSISEGQIFCYIEHELMNVTLKSALFKLVKQLGSAGAFDFLLSAEIASE